MPAARDWEEKISGGHGWAGIVTAGAAQRKGRAAERSASAQARRASRIRPLSSARLRENLAAAEIKLSQPDLKRIAALNQNNHRDRVNGSLWLLEGGPWRPHCHRVEP